VEVPLEPPSSAAERGVAVCSGQAVPDAIDGLAGRGVRGVQTGVAAPMISTIPLPPVGGAIFDQLLLSQTFPDWTGEPCHPDVV
jgi:hypothetical protein